MTGLDTTGLAEDQLAAAETLTGPVRVVAGAGTGKTAVIAARFGRLVRSGVDPGAILVMTFTERAASEMRQRILADPQVADAPWVGTFHSLAMRWLRDEGHRLGIRPGFRILSATERWILMRELMWDAGEPALVRVERPDDLVMPLLKLLERTKQELVPIARLGAWVSRIDDPERRELLAAAVGLFDSYAARCRRDGVLDFDDLLAESVRLLVSEQGVREMFARRYRYVLVDEYQDTNLAQERIVELIAGAAGNICVVGDDDQSIYRFRGASRASMDRFLSCFPSALTLSLGRNRRSTQRIVEVACNVIQRNADRLPKALEHDPEHPPGDPVEVWATATAEEEAGAIASAAVAAVRGGTPPAQIAVLARTHAIARRVAAALAAGGVPFRNRAGQGLYRRPEIRDLVAYLRLLNDQTDLLALARLLSRPPLSLDLEGTLGWLRDGGGELPDAPLRALARNPALRSWVELMVEVSALRTTLGVDDLLFELLNRTGFVDAALRWAADEVESRRIAANVSRFVELVAEYCDRRRDHSLSLFVDYLDQVMRSGLDEDEGTLEGTDDAVQLMTIHQAKGLEFDLVFVPALVEGRLPQPRRRDGLSAIASLELPSHLLEPAVRGREDQLAEERRLFYVATTRARRRLVLSWAGRYEGDRAWRPSRFLDELGDDLLMRDMRTLANDSGDRSDPPPAPIAPEGAGEGPVLSFSSISSYRECPRQHWFRYRLRLPAPAGVEAQFGTILHLVLMRAGRLRQAGRELTMQLLRDLYQEAWDTVGISEPRRRPALEALGWRLLERFLVAGGLQTRPNLLEAPFAVAQDGWTLRGVIDRVDEPADAAQRWRIIDYKTGTPMPVSRLRRDLQLALYALGARHALGLHPLELEIVYLRSGERHLLVSGDELLEEAQRVGGEVAAGVRGRRFEPRPERRRCSICAYRIACSEAL